MKSTMPPYDTLLAEAVQTWTDLLEDPKRVKVQAKMEEVQWKEERLKQALKVLSPIERMQKERDSKALKQ